MDLFFALQLHLTSDGIIIDLFWESVQHHARAFLCRIIILLLIPVYIQLDFIFFLESSTL